MILALVDEAVAAGATQKKACRELGIDVRTVQRWRREDGAGEDRRRGPKTAPANKFSDEEAARVVRTANLPRYRNLPPRQIVALLADEGLYIGSEATFHRLLKRERQNAHRTASRPSQKRVRPREYVATGPGQVWSWDITWLKWSLLRGAHFKLYLVIDIYSRKIVGWAVHLEESSALAAELMERVCRVEKISRRRLLVLHSDNGAPMKGSTLLAKLEELGVMPSFSRPRVSDDNAFAESAIGTLKGSPAYPAEGFEDIERARTWVADFVEWYNETHLHSGIKYVTPADRHRGDDRQKLAKRVEVYEDARRRRPDRWTGKTRDWSPIESVRLNKEPSNSMS